MTIFDYVIDKCFGCGESSPESKYCWLNSACLPDERRRVGIVLEEIDDSEDKQRWINAIDPDHPSYDPYMFGFLSRLGSVMEEGVVEPKTQRRRYDRKDNRDPR